jgi:hypothetical protein
MYTRAHIICNCHVDVTLSLKRIRFPFNKQERWKEERRKEDPFLCIEVQNFLLCIFEWKIVRSDELEMLFLKNTPFVFNAQKGTEDKEIHLPNWDFVSAILLH